MHAGAITASPNGAFSQIARATRSARAAPSISPEGLVCRQLAPLGSQGRPQVRWSSVAARYLTQTVIAPEFAAHRPRLATQPLRHRPQRRSRRHASRYLLPLSQAYVAEPCELPTLL